jgi:hypothetical protein
MEVLTTMIRKTPQVKAEDADKAEVVEEVGEEAEERTTGKTVVTITTKAKITRMINSEAGAEVVAEQVTRMIEAIKEDLMQAKRISLMSPAISAEARATLKTSAQAIYKFFNYSHDQQMGHNLPSTSIQTQQYEGETVRMSSDIHNARYWCQHFVLAKISYPD